MINAESKRLFHDIRGLVGNTPLIEIQFKYKGRIKKIYSKLEYYNITGSIKDRIAYHILYKAYEHNQLFKGMQLCEATSGNTGISFAALGRLLGNNAIIFMPDYMSSERIKLLESYGSDVRLVSKDENGFIGCLNKVQELAAADPSIFPTNQFSNPYNSQAHFLTTGPEIIHSLKKHSLVPDALVAGVGTGGTVMGIGDYLKWVNRHIKIYPVEPASSPILSTGIKTGSHRIQGISDDFVPQLMKFSLVDEILPVDDGDAIIMAQKLASQLGLGVGISSGANFIGAVKALDRLSPSSTIVTVFPDDNKKYLSTDLMENEPVQLGYLSDEIELISYKML